MVCRNVQWKHPVKYEMEPSPVSKSCLPAWCFQWHGAALRRWSRRRSTRLSLWRSAASTDRRPRSLYLEVWGYATGLATSRCPLSVGWGLVRVSSSLQGRWGLGRPGWDVLHVTKTSCGCIMRRSSRGPTPVTWTLTECVSCPHLEVRQVLTGWGGEVNQVFKLRVRKKLTDCPCSRASLLSCCLVTLWRWIIELLNVAKQHAGWTQSWAWCIVECVQTAFLADKELAGFKCSKPHLVFDVYKMWMTIVYFEALLCKKLDVQFWSYFLWQKCKKWKPLIFILYKKMICNLMPEFMFLFFWPDS